VNRCGTPLAILALMVSASVWHAPVLAADHSGNSGGLGQANAIRGNAAHDNADKAPSPAAKGATSFNVIPEAAAQTLQPEGARKLENVPIVFESARSRREVRAPLGDLPGAHQDTKLSLLKNATDPLQERPRSRSDTPSADKQAAAWARLDESPIPEPGTWAVLIAGILGICAVARPRIFSS
jgi:hypothetical protein